VVHRDESKARALLASLPALDLRFPRGLQVQAVPSGGGAALPVREEKAPGVMGLPPQRCPVFTWKGLEPSHV